ncbi:hypothetical protein B0F90DRAFT_1645136, partial [Multifurca ochricompacta]
LRHSILWSDEPIKHIHLLEDGAEFHYGAFLLEAYVPVAVISFHFFSRMTFQKNQSDKKNKK